MTDEMMNAKLRSLESDILEAARTQPVKTVGPIGVALEEKIKLAASLKRQLVDRAAKAANPT